MLVFLTRLLVTTKVSRNNIVIKNVVNRAGISEQYQPLS